MTIREMRTRLGDTQSQFSARYHIPFRTVQNWEAGIRNPPEYILTLLGERVRSDLVNRKTMALPAYDSHKADLPKRGDYVGALSWLKAIQEAIGEPVVFALDQALMCQGSFLGRSDEYVIWVYGDDALSRFNGVVVLGNRVSPYDVKEKNCLRYTNFNRTLADALANESILDMQGITEALSRYYVSHGNSFEGVSAVPEYQEEFERLLDEAVDYYRS